MFEQFTERARRVIILAQEEAKRLDHSAVGTEHILLGIVREATGLACEVLESLNISLDRVRAEIESAIGRGERSPYEEVAFTPRAKKVLELALSEARQMRHNYIGTEHLLLGLIREGEGVAASVLAAMGADLERARAQVMQILAEQKGPKGQMFHIRPAGTRDRGWIEQVLRDRWGGSVIVTRGKAHDALTLPAKIAERSGHPCGLATYRIDGHDCELVTLDALEQHRGIGSALLDAVTQSAREARCTRLWLITTNDNLDALRFYQRRGFSLVAVHPNAVAQARQLKPSIPQVGNYEIPIRDEMELERPL